MKITKVYCEHYRWPKEKPIANGKHVYTHNELNRVCVETDEGITGYGSSWAVHNIEEIAAPIIGEDPLNTERLWSKLYVPKFLGRRGNTLWTISAIDIALWDIRSKVTKLPLYQLLGGYRESIPFYIAGGYYGPDKGIPELQKEMEQYVSWGAKAVKMKVGALSIKEDAARVKAMKRSSFRGRWKNIARSGLKSRWMPMIMRATRRLRPKVPFPLRAAKMKVPAMVSGI